MTRAPAVSVVIPTYNRERALARALDSVFAQTLPDVEVVVVDDGSVDGTAAMIRKDPRPVVYLEQPNAGPAAARNLGLRAARGAFLAFLDSDDVYLPRHLEASLHALESRGPGGDAPGLVHGASEVVDAAGRSVKIQRPGPKARGRVLRALLEYNFVMPSTVVMRREVYERVGPLNERLRFAEDWLYWLRIAAEHAFALVEEPLVRFQRSIVSASRRPLDELVAVNLEMMEIAFADPVLGPRIGDRRDAALAALYRGYAATALETLDLPAARRFILRAARHRPWDPRHVPLALKALLPRGVLAAGRSVLRRTG